MNARRLAHLTAVVVVAALLGTGAAPAVAAKSLPAPPVITSAVVIDTETVDLAWTPVKGVDHYVIWAPLHDAIYVDSTTTRLRVTDLYPGDVQTFIVIAETKRNVELGRSEPVEVATPPETPYSPWWLAGYDDQLKLTTSGGLGCFTWEIFLLEDDGSFTSLGQITDVGSTTRLEWYTIQPAGTTETYVARCLSRAGLSSTWSEPAVVAL
jgi:hypothetical protein